MYANLFQFKNADKIDFVQCDVSCSIIKLRFIFLTQIETVGFTN